MLSGGHAVGAIFYSTDSGLNWNNTGFGGVFTSAEISDDNSIMVLPSPGGGIWISRNSGQNWEACFNVPSYKVAINNNASIIYTGVIGDFIYKSTDFGQTWNPILNSGQRNWSSISCSSDGSKIVASVTSGYLYISNDYGETWNEHSEFVQQQWSSIVCSNNGILILASIGWAGTGGIYSSFDGGESFQIESNAGGRVWQSMAFNPDGKKVIAGSVGSVYIGVLTITEPTINTNSLSNIQISSALSGGNITYDGGSAVTVRGVCWNTTGSPTIADSKTTDGTGTGTFTSSITGLTQSTIYYVRAYATNSAGTAYGDEKMFTTIPTLPEWGLIVFGSLIAFFAVRKIIKMV